VAKILQYNLVHVDKNGPLTYLTLDEITEAFEGLKGIDEKVKHAIPMKYNDRGELSELLLVTEAEFGN
jgi:hypothetical protein